MINPIGRTQRIQAEMALLGVGFFMRPDVVCVVFCQSHHKGVSAEVP